MTLASPVGPAPRFANQWLWSRLGVLATISGVLAIIGVVPPAYAATGITAQYNPGTSTYAPFFAGVGRAQMFTATVSGTPSSVQIYVNVPNASSPTAGVDVTIQGVTGGLPNGTILASGSIAQGAIATGTTPLSTVSLTSSASLAAGTQYALVVTSATTLGQNYQFVGGLNSAYTGGTGATANPSWAIENRWGYWFRVYVSGDFGCPTIDPVTDAPSQGDDGSYELSTLRHLQWVRDADISSSNAQWSYDYRLISNIDMTGCTWGSGIGTSATPFTGDLDGSGYAIANVDLDFTGGDATSTALIPYAGDGITTPLISDLAVSGAVTVDEPAAGEVYAALLVGRFVVGASTTVLEDVTVSGTIDIDFTDNEITNVGGVASNISAADPLVGVASGIDSSVTVTDVGSSPVERVLAGGIFGDSSRINLIDSSSAGSIVLDGLQERSTPPTRVSVGGISGADRETSWTDVSSATDVEVAVAANGATKEANVSVGSAAGQMDYVTQARDPVISGLVATGDVTVVNNAADLAGGEESNVGGAIGSITTSSTLQEIESSGRVTATTTGGATHVGGAVGLLGDGATVASLTARGLVTATTSDNTIAAEIGIGGAIGFVSDEAGYSGSSLDRISAIGDVNASYVESTTVGGLIGQDESGTLTRGSASGSVTATDVGAGITACVGVSDAFRVDVGGLIGLHGGASVTQSSSSGAVTVHATKGRCIRHIGGLIGYATGDYTLLFSTSDVTVIDEPAVSAGLGSTLVGGLLGIANSVSQSFSSGAVSVVTSTDTTPLGVGGLAGSGIAIDSYSSSPITVSGASNGPVFVGGVVGYGGAGGPSERVYANATISTSLTGSGALLSNGLVGDGVDDTAAGADESFCIDALSPPSCTGSTGYPGYMADAAVMTSYATYASVGWDITESCSATTIWGICPTINNGFPYLAGISAADPFSTTSRQPVYAEFAFFLPDGTECTSISPMRVEVGTSVELPGREALCRSMPGALVAGWTIPVPTGFTGAGSSSLPFNPGHEVEVVDSQRFTVVPVEPILELEFGANVGDGVECVASEAPNRRPDGRVMWVWVPREDASIARIPDRASCTPPGHVLVGWNTRGDGTGEVFRPGAPLPAGWQSDLTNRHTLHAMWAAA